MKKKILIIDDDADFAESLSTWLQAAGHQVEHASNADAGIAIARADRPDVILCDVMMQERTEGFFAVQRLRQTPGLEQTRILVISSVYQAVPEFKVPPDRKWLPHDGFLQKPVNAEQLLKLVEA